MKSRMHVLTKAALRACAVALVLTLLAASLSGCRLLNGLDLGPLNNLVGGGAVSNDSITSLNAAVFAARAHAADNGTLKATIQRDGEDVEFLLSDGEKTLELDLLEGDIAYTGDESACDRVFNYTIGTIAGDAAAMSKIASGYKEHVASTYANSVVTVLERDADFDGQNEYVLLVEGVFDGGAVGLGSGDSLLDAAFRFPVVCVYLDFNGSEIVYQAVVTDECDVVDARLINGLLKLTNSAGVSRTLLITDVATVFDTAYSEEYFSVLCNGYANALAAQGHDDVRVKRANVAAAEGDEALFCYGDEYGYTFEVVAYHQGRPVKVYSFGAQNDGALFLVPVENRYDFFAYQQLFDNTYNQSYSYQTFMLDADYRIVETDRNAVSVDLNTSVDITANNFFKIVMNRLNGAIVCYDPYQLTGYTVLPSDNEISSAIPESRYLTITNCSTSKSGYVSIKDPGSWLNLREGPSTSYNRTLLDPSDAKSYVKQSLYSPVTILSPVNTGDKTNPIWVKIQINYMNRTLVGYSSQNFITIPGIQSLRVGETFTVEVDTNDSGLRWTSSDNRTAYVDPFSGRVTAYKSGLVLITVTSDSGLEESCLIAIG